MKRAALLAVCAVLAAGAATEQVRGQTVPGAPAISSVTAGASTLTVAWTAPSDTGGEALSSYDLRHIPSDAADKADANWEVETGVGSLTSLQHKVSGLRDSTGYDVQVRAVNATGAGAWSDTFARTTADHGDRASAATVVALDSSIEARIDGTDDWDVFQLVLSEQVDLWIYTVSDFDTRGQLVGPNVTRFRDDGGYPSGWLNFAIRQQLEPGTYYIGVDGFEEASGPYTLEIRAAPAPGTTQDSATSVASGELAPGRIASGGDVNYFTFELAAAADVWIMGPSSDRLDTVGMLLDSDGTELVESDDNEIHALTRSFLIRRELAAGAYYVKVRAFSSTATGAYTLFYEEVPDTGGTAATARPLSLHSVVAGRVDSGASENYFRLTAEEDMWLLMRGYADSSVSVTGDIFDDQGNEVYAYPFSASGFTAFSRVAFLTAGTYSIRISEGGAPGSGGGYFLGTGIEIHRQAFHEECSAVTSPISDPLAGCQWHLHNTGALRPGGAAQDINVLEAWETTMGAGVNVAVVDTGMNHGHPDLSPNVRTERNHDYHETNTLSDIHRPGASTHGTNVAGLIAARDDDQGMRGVAPRASIYGYNAILHAQGIQFYSALAMTRDLADTAVSNNSWGSGDTGQPFAAPGDWERAIETGITQGFGGKGISYVWAGGNGGLHDNANLEGRASFYGVVAVCAITHGDVRTWYSERGANLWVCAPGGDGALGIATTHRGWYTGSFTGTSASAPIVSGVVALMRATNPELSWRDVKLILAASARKNSPTDSGWEQGALQYGSTTDHYRFNHTYGFGAVDAGAAVSLADGWENAPTWRSVTALSSDADLALPTNTSDVVETHATIEGGHVGFVEFVAVNIDIDHAAFRDLEFELVSPSGAVSKLTSRPTSIHYTFRPLREPFRFGSARHLGEDAAGQWTLRIKDYRTGDTGRLKSWRITVYGHGYAPARPTITSIAPAATSLTVNWSAPDDTGASAISGYDLRYIRSDAADRSSSNWTTEEDIWSSGALNYALTGLTGGVKYLIQMRASNAEGVGSWSTAFSMSTSAPMPPDAPTIDSVTARSAEFTVVWQAPTTGSSGITRYAVRYIKTSDDESDDANWTDQTSAWVSGGGDLQYTVTGVDNDVDYDVQVRARNSAGTGAWSATTVVRPVRANADPEFPASESGSRTVPESAAAGTSVGAPVAATDGDGDDLAYTLSGGGGVFSIDGATGQVKTETALDHEGTPSYSVSVTVSDMKDANGEADSASDDTIALAISVGDVNEAPVVTGETSIDYAENGTGAVEDYSVSDPDGDAITWTLEGADAGDFEISAAGVLMFSESPDREAPKDANRNNEYLVRVKAADDDGLSGRLDVKVTVTNVDEPPSLEGADTVDYDERGTGDVANYSATDPEGATIGWSLEGPDAGTFAISESGVLTFRETPDHEDPKDANGDNDYLVTIVASDGNPLLDARLPVKVTVENRDEAGMVTLSSLQPQAGTALAATLADPDGSLSGQSWQWEVSSNRSTWADIDGETAATYTPGADDVGKYLRVTVSYSDGHGTGKSLTVALPNAVQAAPVVTNLPPAFPATENGERSVAENTPAGRSIGSPVEAGDPDRDFLTYTLDTTGSEVFDINASTGQLQTKAPLDHEQRDQYAVTVTATDPSGGSDAADVTITVEDVNEAPAVTGLTGQTALRHSENDTGLVDAYAADEPENDAVIWSLVGTDAGDFEISAGGVLAFRDPPDHEAPADSNRNNEYLVTVRASDDGDPALTGTLNVAVTVSNVDEGPELSGETRIDYAENGSGAVATYSARDPEGEDISWSLEGRDAGAFEVSDGGVLTFREAPDHEQPVDLVDRNNEYVVTVVASDGSPRLDARLPVTVTVTDVNEPVTLTGPAAPAVPEHAGTSVATYEAFDPEGARLGWSLAGPDAGHFEISGLGALNDRGALSFRAQPDFETRHAYSVVLRVSDGANTPAQQSVTVTVENVNEPGTVTVSSLQPQAEAELTAGLTDPDGAVPGEAWQWESSGDQTNWSPIPGATGPAYTPVDGDVNTYLRVTVSYSDGHGSGKTAEAELPNRVRAAPVKPNEPPAFADGESGQRSVLENTPPGQPVGSPLEATDPDLDDHDRLTYTLDATGANTFDIVGDSGQLLTKAPLDREVKDSYVVTVTVTDPSPTSDATRVTIDIEDENEPPLVAGPTVLQVPERSTRPVARYQALDPEKRPVTWNVSGEDRDDFEISATGDLGFGTAPDFDAPADDNRDNVYEVTVEATDDGPNLVDLDVTITVARAEQAPTVPPFVGGGFGGGGGGPSGPSPSEVDFEWTVKRDIEALGSTHDSPTGSWSNGSILWITENGDGADDAVYAYDLKTGERVEEREFELDETNRAPRGLWSDRTTVWVSDSGQERLFAYDLVSGERVPEREIALVPRNGKARGIWSDGEAMWVLDGGKNALFAYDLGSGELLAEYELDDANDDAHDIWSDGVTIWVSNHNPKRLFAYRLEEGEDGQHELVRNRDEEFGELSKASNNSPRGIWSDGDVMYVADASDHRVYSYNMPDAIDARLASLTLSGVELEFSSDRPEYEGTVADGLTVTTVEAQPVQSGVRVAIDPPDGDGDEANGHQVALEGVEEITVTVTSRDSSRTKVYRVTFPEARSRDVARHQPGRGDTAYRIAQDNGQHR